MATEINATMSSPFIRYFSFNEMGSFPFPQLNVSDSISDTEITIVSDSLSGVTAEIPIIGSYSYGTIDESGDFHAGSYIAPFTILDGYNTDYDSLDNSWEEFSISGSYYKRKYYLIDNDKHIAIGLSRSSFDTYSYISIFWLSGDNSTVLSLNYLGNASQDEIYKAIYDQSSAGGETQYIYYNESPVFVYSENRNGYISASQVYNPNVTFSNLTILRYPTGSTFGSASVDVSGFYNTDMTLVTTYDFVTAITGTLTVNPEEPETDPDDQDKPSQNSPNPSKHYGGGTGDFDYTSDDVDEPSEPDIKYNSIGCAGIWTPSDDQLKSIMNKLWESSFMKSLVDLFGNNNYFEAILSLKKYPFTVSSTATATMALGTVSTGVTVNIASEQFVTLKYSIKGKTFTGDFNDYEPYTHVAIHLPFIGIVDLDTNSVIGKTIIVTYMVDISCGETLCYIKSDNQILYTYSCKLGYDIPITAQDTRNQSRNMAGFAMSAVSGSVTTAGLALPYVATGAMGTSSGLMNGSANEAPIQKSGSLGGSASNMDSFDVYLIYKCPNVSYNTRKHPEIHGYRASGVAKLSNLKGKGYTELEFVNPAIQGCTASEMADIENMMKGGVIL